MNKKSVFAAVRRYRESIFAVALLIFFALVIFFTKDIRLLVVNTTVDARFWPKVIGIAGCGLSVLLLIQSIVVSAARSRREADAPAEEKPKAGFRERFHAPLTLGLMFLYIAGLQTFGFVVMTLTYLFLQFLLLSKRGERSIWKLALITLIFTAAVYLLFRYAFQMMLPMGTIWS